MSRSAGVIQKAEAKNQQIINILSLAIPIAVAVLLGIRTKVDLGSWTKVLPHVIGVINTATSVLLILGLYFIRRKQLNAHKKAMLGAFGLGAIFLVCYILYHGGEGWIRPVYYFFLISHIVLSIAVVRFVLLAVYYALTNQVIKHKKIVKFAFPVWLYVSVTGVIVYLMISPYYSH
jgi:putative membrane protein